MAVPSGSRDRPAPAPASELRNSVHSANAHSQHEGVVMTHEIRSRERSVNSSGSKMINQYEFILKVGKGQHGEVYLARDTTKGNMDVAIKCVPRKNKSDRMNKLRKRNLPRTSNTQLVDQLGSTEHKIRKEIAIMKKLNHPHVVRLLEVIDDVLYDKIYMVMEYLGGGEIKWRTKSDNPLLRVDQTRRICRDVILGLEYLHYQGIIHRDIKPANLLWTADRRTVKISDFGVSTFSYAQRLAAAGKGNLSPEDTDPILMDESDLSKTAGTPMFLAPEIVCDATVEASSSALNLQNPRRKPPITKAIDIWAFGVTLYGLLFGILPFNAKNEFEIYRVIRSQDWDVPETMGLDQLPTGGRHQGRPKRGVEESEGCLVVDLLGRLLEKDARKRITLEEVKRHPWILRDLDNPEEWLRETKLRNYLSLEPTPDETKTAMSLVRFRWFPSRLGSRLSTFFRNVRPQRSFRRPRQDDDDDTKHVGVHSAPNFANLSRQRTSTGHHHHHHHHHRGRDRDRDQPSAHPHHSSVREKARRRSRADLSRNKSAGDIGSKPLPPTPKPFDPWPAWHAGAASSSSTSATQTTAGPSRTGKAPETSLQVPSRSSRVSSPLPSPVSSSQVSTPTTENPGQYSPDSERPRSMVSSWIRKLGNTHRQSSYNPFPAAETPLGGTSAGRAYHYQYPSATAPPSRDSGDALSSHVTSRQSSMSMSGGKLTKAMRAASWTGPEFVQARPSEDMTSLYSGERPDDALDDDTLLLGAGGIAHSPVPSCPNSALLSTVSSANSIGAPAGAMSAAHAILARSPEGATDVPATTQQDPGAGGRSPVSGHGHCHVHGHGHGHGPGHAARLRTTSPLAQVSYNHSELSVGSGVSYDSADDGSSIFTPPPATRVRRSREIVMDEDVDVPLNEIVDDDDSDEVSDVDDSDAHGGEGASFDLQPSTSQMYRDEDEESEDDEEVHLEVRTRRPSASAADMSPPRRSVSARRPPPGERDRECEQRPMICT
ncbi:kinase-like domain-containing protein [Cubamyces lactineus]|nr:kinase-like domain-containing protein [Cubamyces lactineus]